MTQVQGQRLSVRSPSDLGLPPWWIEALVLIVGYVAYQVVQVVVTGSAHSAIERATWVWTWEQRLHLDPELWLNQRLAGDHTLVILAGLYYGTAHFLLTPTSLIWVRLRRPARYLRLRNTLVGASLCALLVYWLLPMAPPRLSIPGIVDTSMVNDVLSAGSPSWPASLANQYAAMPSLHVAWAVWVALALAVSFPESRSRLLIWCYPALTAIVVMSTGNHFLTDVVAGALLVMLCWRVVPTQGLLLHVRRSLRDDRGSSAAESDPR